MIGSGSSLALGSVNRDLSQVPGEDEIEIMNQSEDHLSKLQRPPRPGLNGFFSTFFVQITAG
jgi:hypothetical protein